MNASDNSQRYPSYLIMVAKAILSCSEKRMLVREIYSYIKHHYPHVIANHISWKNSVRHNLSNHDCFYKIRNLNHGASYWSIHPQFIGYFEDNDFSRRWLTGPKRRQPTQQLSYQNYIEPPRLYQQFPSYPMSNYYNNLMPEQPTGYFQQPISTYNNIIFSNVSHHEMQELNVSTADSFISSYNLPSQQMNVYPYNFYENR